MDGAFAAGAVSATNPQEAAAKTIHIYQNNQTGLQRIMGIASYFVAYNAQTGQILATATDKKDELTPGLGHHLGEVRADRIIVLQENDRLFSRTEVFAAARMLDLNADEWACFEEKMKAWEFGKEPPPPVPLPAHDF